MHRTIEENLTGCYRLSIPPDKVEIRRLDSGTEGKKPEAVTGYGLRK